MTTLDMVLRPATIEAAWIAGEFGALGYLAEALGTWPVAGLEQTDPVQFRQIIRGLAEARALGWVERLNAEALHRLEEMLLTMLENQRAEGFALSPGEVAEVRQRLAAEWLGKTDACHATGLKQRLSGKRAT